LDSGVYTDWVIAVRSCYSVLDNYHLRFVGMGDMGLRQKKLRDYLATMEHIV
jgi:hypothetical protein